MFSNFEVSETQPIELTARNPVNSKASHYSICLEVDELSTFRPLLEHPEAVEGPGAIDGAFDEPSTHFTNFHSQKEAPQMLWETPLASQKVRGLLESESKAHLQNAPDKRQTFSQVQPSQLSQILSQHFCEGSSHASPVSKMRPYCEISEHASEIDLC